MQIKTNDKNKYLLLLFLLLVVTFILKIIFVLQIPGPIIFGDEIMYKKRAAEIYYLHSYLGAIYPPAYPFVISISFLFDNNFYSVMKIINVCLNTLAVFGVWKLGTLFLNYNYSLLCCVFATLLPVNLLTIPKIVCENLYFPLMIFTCWYLIKILNKNSWRQRVVLGFLLLALHLTKHITLVIMPAFLIVWFVEWIDDKGWHFRFKRDKIISVCQILAVYGGGYVAWIIYMLNHGLSLMSIVGLKVSGGVGSAGLGDQATLGRLGVMTILYSSYFFLSLLFMLPVCLSGTMESIIKPEKVHLSKFTALVWLITGAAMVASVRHSWRVEYNYPRIIHILGRYLWYVPFLFIIIFFAYLSSNKVIQNKNRLYIFHISCFILNIIAILVLVKDKLYSLGAAFLTDFNVKDLYYLLKYKGFVLVLLLWLSGLLIVLIFIKRYKIWAVSATFIMLLFSSAGAVFYNEVEYEGVFGKELSEFNELYNLGAYDFLINDTSYQNFAGDMDFWTAHTDHAVILSGYVNFDQLYDKNAEVTRDYMDKYYPGYKKVELLDIKSIEKMQNKSNGLVLTKIRDEYKEKPLYRFRKGDKDYGIYEYPIHLYDNLKLVYVYPNNIYGRFGFNIQNNLKSAMGLKTSLKNTKLEVFINNESVGEIDTDDEGVASIYVDEKFYKYSDELIIQLMNENGITEDLVSNTITVPVIDTVKVYEANVEQVYYVLSIQTNLLGEHCVIYINGEEVGEALSDDIGMVHIQLPVIERAYKEFELQVGVKGLEGEFISGKYLWKLSSREQ